MMNNISRWVLILLCICTNMNMRLIAGDLDGTSSIVYKSAHFVFHKQRETAEGFVRLNDGFTVTSDGHGMLGTCIGVGGAIDLRETGTLELLDTLKLDPTVTLSSGGKILGNGNAIILSGDLTIPAGKILHISGDTLIEGNGNTLYLDEHAQLFVDTDITLTLRNLSVKTTRNVLTNPAIRCAASKSKLVLDDVMLAPVGDFLFKEGQLFIHNDVVFTGTSSFIYMSTQPSYITTNSCLGFDNGTTFSFAPATNSNEQLVLSDCSSKLYLNGCSLLTTATGMRLAKGGVLFDNKITCNSYAACDISTTPATLVDEYVETGFFPTSVAWAPDGKFLAVVNSDSNTLQVFAFNGENAPTQIGSNVATGASPNSVSWSPDGKFLAVVNYSGNTLQVFAFNGENTPTQVGSNAATGASPNSVSWSPDGTFLAVVNFTGNTLQVFTFNGTSTPIQIGSNVITGETPASVSWSPRGNFLAVVNYSSNTLQVFTFNGTSTPTQVGSNVSTGPGSGPASVSWSPDGKFLSIVNYDNNTLQVFTFNGTSTPTQVGSNVATGNSPNSCAWSHNGRFLVVVNSDSNTLQVFAFNGTSTPIHVGVDVSTQSNPYSVLWSPDDSFLAEANYVRAGTIGVLRVNYINPIAPQAISQGLVFGKRSLGSNYNCDVKLLSGAFVEVNGFVNDDSA